jgi:hypothetical protein
VKVEALGEIEIATKLLEEEDDSEVKLYMFLPKFFLPKLVVNIIYFPSIIIQLLFADNRC